MYWTLRKSVMDEGRRAERFSQLQEAVRATQESSGTWKMLNFTGLGLTFVLFIKILYQSLLPTFDLIQRLSFQKPFGREPLTYSMYLLFPVLEARRFRCMLSPPKPRYWCHSAPLLSEDYMGYKMNPIDSSALSRYTF
ncbi:hypothetical protein WG66_006011 [Moniliophthora roreri]|nr:hypothetical protein WG66_006011 [Moniliophthora roreri]